MITAWFVKPSPILIFDSFVDFDGQSLAAHVGELNATWVDGANQNSGAFARITSNRLTKDNSSLAAILYNGTAPNANCYVQAKITMLTSMPVNVALVARLNPASDNYYSIRHNSNQWQLRVTINGTATTLDSGNAIYNDTMVANDERLIRLEVNGSSLKVFIDGIQRISATDTTHTSGRTGIRFGGAASATTGYAIADFTVGNI